MTTSTSCTSRSTLRGLAAPTWARVGSACLLVLAAAAGALAQTPANPPAHVHAQMAAASSATAPATKAGLPGDSVYHLQLPLTDQSGHSFRIDELAGRPVLVSMFYGSCKFVCPMLIDTMRATSEQLPAADRDRVALLMVSIDPAHDSVAALKRVATEHQLDPARWSLARTDAKSVRKLAAVLGIQYRALPDGEFNHSTELILLDGQGHITARTAKMGAVDGAFVQQVSAAAAGARP